MIFDNNLRLHMQDVTLQVLHKSHKNQLVKLASDKKIWKYASKPFYEQKIFEEEWLDKALTQMNQKKRISFVISLGENIAGSSSYYDIDIENKKLNIGYTWLHSSFWGTKVNLISKLILIGHAIDFLQFNRVGFVVDSINSQSCNSLQKLGIKHEGTLRNHLILSNGRIRHSAIFSVVREEWQDIKKYIKKKIDSLCV